jgi:hypothetical protein
MLAFGEGAEKKDLVTEQMILAGVLEAREHMLGEDLAALVTKVYLAMLNEHLSKAPPLPEPAFPDN